MLIFFILQAWILKMPNQTKFKKSYYGVSPLDLQAQASPAQAQALDLHPPNSN